MKKRLMFLGAAILAVGATSISFAAGSTGSTTVSVSAASTTPTITASSSPEAGLGTGPNGAVPSIQPVIDSAQSVTAGDLYTVHPNSDGDVVLTVYLTNADKLAKDYTYLNLNVTVYVGTYTNDSAAPTWGSPLVPATDASTNAAVTTQLLTLNNGYVTFYLTGITAASQIYGVSIDSGSDYAISSNTSTGSLSPAFTVTVSPGA